MSDNIIIEPAEYISKYKIKVSKKFLLKIKYLFTGYTTSHQCLKINELLKEDKLFYELYNIYEFLDFFKELSEKINSLSEPCPSYKNDNGEQIFVDFSVEKKDIERLTSQLLELEQKDIFDLIENSQTKQIEDILNLYEQIFILNIKMYKKRDLTLEKFKLIDSLKNIVSLEQLKEIELKYNELLKQNNIELLEQFLMNLQKIIKEDYKKKITNVNDFKPGQPFKFLCHATRNVNWDGDFRDKYVSTSLLTNEIFGTYSSSYGFIVKPDNIVGADSKDMYVKNFAENDDQIISSSISKIHSIEKLVKDCKKRMLEEDGNVYNEVVINGFSPIAIFCKTSGEKTLNYNYKQALELQKSFPHLKIIDIDLSLYLEGKALEISKQNLIFKLLKKIHPNYDYNDDFVKRIDVEEYDLFWKWYTNLKAKPQYTEEQIINLFQKNQNLLSISMFPEKLFNGDYEVEEIKFALLYGYNYRIKDLLNGNFNNYNISSIARLLKDYRYNPILLNLFPGINYVIDLFPKIKITEEIINEINNIKELNFNKMYIYLNECYKKQLNSDKVTIDSELSVLFSKKENLEQQYLEQQKLLSEQQFSKKVINAEFYYNLAIADYNDTLQKKQENEEIIKKIEQDLKLLILNKDQYLEQIKHYERHKFINRNKIKKLKIDVCILEEKINALLKIKDTNELKNKTLNDELFNLKQKFKQKNGIDLFEYPSELQKANEIFDFLEEARIDSAIFFIKRDLEELKEQIETLLIKQKELNVQINDITKIEEDKKIL